MNFLLAAPGTNIDAIWIFLWFMTGIYYFWSPNNYSVTSEVLKYFFNRLIFFCCTTIAFYESLSKLISNGLIFDIISRYLHILFAPFPRDFILQPEIANICYMHEASRFSAPARTPWINPTEVKYKKKLAENDEKRCGGNVEFNKRSYGNFFRWKFIQSGWKPSQKHFKNLLRCKKFANLFQR